MPRWYVKQVNLHVSGLFLIEKSGFENKLISQLETEIATSITEKDLTIP